MRMENRTWWKWLLVTWKFDHLTLSCHCCVCLHSILPIYCYNLQETEFHGLFERSG
jgi:hypothetical protein